MFQPVNHVTKRRNQFLANPESLAEAVFYAVSLGGDADTISAMTGAIVGAYHGAGAIPPEWLAALENGLKGRDYVQGLAADLFDVWLRRGATPPA